MVDTVLNFSNLLALFIFNVAGHLESAITDPDPSKEIIMERDQNSDPGFEPKTNERK